jgi:D-sedoheptulose 7-phosphate isomerase
MSSHAPTNAVKPVTAVLHGSTPLPYSFSGCWARIQEIAQTLLNWSLAPRDENESGDAPVERSNFKPAPVGPNERPVIAAGTSVPAFIASYRGTLDHAWQSHDWSDVVLLVETLQRCWREDHQVFLCGNGGSAANAIHLANDLLYGVDKVSGRGLRVTALPSNAAVLTCLANDIAYEDIFAQQLTVLAKPGDILIAFSGSGNSPNIVKALARAREIGLTSFAILGFDGGKALMLADHPIHFPVQDMQVAEDLQMMVGHMAMQWLSRHP